MSIKNDKSVIKTIWLKPKHLFFTLIYILEIIVLILLLMISSTKKTVQVMNTIAETKKVAITFDDGPHPIYTPRLLDGLKQRNVRATFFVTGENSEIHKDIVKRIYDEGHLIGNHTYSHIQLTSSNRELFKQELIRTNEVIKGVTGYEPIYVRPPYGAWDKKLESELNMFPVLWTVDPLDWCSNNVTCIVRDTLKNVKENDIILLHDYYDTSVTAALQIIDELLNRGYTFVTVEEILFD